MSKHSPTPWRIEECVDTDYSEYSTIVDAAGEEVTAACLHGEGAVACGARPHMPRSDLERIVACVNFCQQFPTEFLAQRQLVYCPNWTATLMPVVKAEP